MKQERYRRLYLRRCQLSSWHSVHVFDRQIAYDQPAREDEKAPAGMLVSGWFIWTKGYKEYPKLHIIDIQDCIAKKSK